MTTKMTTATVKTKLASCTEHVHVYKGVYTAKIGFYHRYEGSADKLAATIKAKLPKALIVSTDEVLASWPESCYWIVKFTI